MREATFPSLEYHSIEAVVDEFLSASERPTLTGACFGVAGPVEGGRARLTNLPWLLDEEHLAKGLRAPRVRLLNDLEAAAFGMLFLASQDFEVLQPGKAGARGATKSYPERISQPRGNPGPPCGAALRFP